MRIAQVAPLYESVPPQGYGGTERVVSFLTEELVRQNHEVTLFASGDSVTQAKLVPICPRSLRLDKNCRDPFTHHLLMLERLFKEHQRFDIIHFHCDYIHYPFSRRYPCRHVTTLHGRLDIPDLQPLYQEFSDVPLVSISESQRQPLAAANWQGTVYHGLPANLHTFRDTAGKYLAFLGRISPEKRVDRAIEIALRTGRELKIAAKVDAVDRIYFEELIRPLLTKAGRQVEFIGEVGGKDKDDFLGNAYALLFPIDWPEPFGLVMIEALACGTPVVAFRCGSVPEVLEDGVTGYIVDDIDQAVAAVNQVDQLSRYKCREVFERRFVDSRMTKDYLAIYSKLLHKKDRQPMGRIIGVDAPHDSKRNGKATPYLRPNRTAGSR